MKKYLYYTLLLALFCFCTKNTFASDLQKEINDIKEDIKVLQRQMYRDGSNAKSTNTSTNSNLNSSIQVKMGEYDETLRTLNGRVDEVEHQIKEVDKKVDKITRDMEIRFKILEGKQIPSNLSAPTPTIPTTYSAPVANGASKSVTGSSIQGDDLKPIGNKTQKSSQSTSQQNGPKKLISDEDINIPDEPIINQTDTTTKTQNNTALSPKDMYDAGKKAFNANLLDEAEIAFNSILSQYPKDSLASNAQYWLGEVYYKQGKYDKAKVAFKKGYENYPKGNKSADSFFKLGITLEAQNEKNKACVIYTNFSSEFPKVEEELAKKVREKSKKLGC